MANKKYSDIDLDLTPHPITGDVAYKFDTEAVKRSIRNLVFTGKFDKPFHPEISCGVRDLLFELSTPVTAALISKSIEDCINTYEPRVNLYEVGVVSTDEHTYQVTILYSIINNPDPVDTQELEFSLERIR